MNLLLSHEGDVLGTTPTPDNAYRHEMLLRIPVFVITSLPELRQLPVELTGRLLANYNAKSVPDLWKRLRKTKGLPKWGKVSVKDILRCMYTRDPELALDEDELISTIPGASWVSIATAISMLKNPKYSDGPTMTIVQKEGKYRSV